MQHNKKAYPVITPMIGRQFGWLTVIDRAGSWKRKGIKKYASWRCVCTCGQFVVVPGFRLRRGKKKACGINNHVWAAQSRGGLTTLHRSEYQSFARMHDRCENKRHRNYKSYGGRGIKVCARWKKFENFLKDMGGKPTPAHTIERKDNDGNYEPDNCRWATRAEQSRNMRNSVFVEHEGQRKLLIDVCAELGVTRSVMYGRLRNGWPLDLALLMPVRHKRRNVVRQRTRSEPPK